MILIEDMLTIGVSCERADESLQRYGMSRRFCSELSRLKLALERVPFDLSDPMNQESERERIEARIEALGQEAQAKVKALA